MGWGTPTVSQRPHYGMGDPPEPHRHPHLTPSPPPHFPFRFLPPNPTSPSPSGSWQLYKDPLTVMPRVEGGVVLQVTVLMVRDGGRIRRAAASAPPSVTAAV